MPNYSPEQIKQWQNSAEYKALGESFLSRISSGGDVSGIQGESDAAMAKMFSPQAKYLSAATDEYNPIFNSKVATLKNALAQNTLALQNQKLGVNNNFDTQVNNQNMNNKFSQNNFSNQVGARGLGRSSVAVTGLGEMDMINNRHVGEINNARQGTLSGIDAQITQEQNGFNNTVATMEADKTAMINARIREMAEKQDAIDYRDKRDLIGDNRYDTETLKNDTRYNTEYTDGRSDVQYNRNYQTGQDKIEASKYIDSINFRNKEYADSRNDKSKDYALRINAANQKQSASNEISQEDITNSAWKAFASESANGKGQQYLEDNQSDLIDAIGYSEYLKMLKEARERSIPLNSKTTQKTYNDARAQHVRSYNQRPQSAE